MSLCHAASLNIYYDVYKTLRMLEELIMLHFIRFAVHIFQWFVFILFYASTVTECEFLIGTNYGTYMYMLVIFPVTE